MAGILALFLGINVWISLVLTPVLTSGVLARHPAIGVVAPLPLLLLLGGIWRRSPVVLSFAYPAALLLPTAVDARVASGLASNAWSLPLATVGLIGFLLGTAALAGPGVVFATPTRTRRLAGSLLAEAPGRWQRRRRVYFALIALSAIFPAALLYQVALSPSTRGYLEESYPEGRAPALLAVLLLGVLALWLSLFAVAFVDPLRRHRTGDKELVADLDRLRAETKQATPRLVFYIGVVAALALMALLVSMRMSS